MARLARRRDRRAGQVTRALPARPAHGTRARQGRRRPGDGADRLHQHDPAPSRSRGSRATSTSNAASARSSAGTRWSWSTARTIGSTASAVTSRPTRRRPRCTRSASTTSSAARATAATATRCSSRATPRRASTRVRSSKAASPRSSSTTSGARSAAGPVVVPAPAPHADVLGVPDGVDGARSDQRGVPGALQPLPLQPRDRRHVEGARCGASSATARSTSPRRWPRSPLAARERLDNLIFVVNCNLQRLDGPVRGNGKVIQEFESIFRGMGWNVIKVVWGRGVGRPARARRRRRARQPMNSTVDGEFQKYAVESGAYIREHFFGPDPRLRKMVEHLTDEDLQRAAARRSRLPQALRRVQGRGRARGLADRDPRQDGQGLDARPRLRGAQRDAPDQEDDGGRLQDVPRPPVPRDPRRATSRGELPPYYHPGYRLARVRVPDGAPARARRLPARAGRARQDRRRSRATTSSTSSPRGPARRCRRRRPRRSPGCCARC